MNNDIIFWVFTKPIFNTNLSIHSQHWEKCELSGHEYPVMTLKKNHESIQKRIDKQYRKWLDDNKDVSQYSVLYAYPRTRKEVVKIQARIDKTGDL